MTMPDTDKTETPSMARYWLMLVAWSVILAFVLIAAGVIVGFIAGMDSDIGFKDVAVMGVCLSIIAVGGYFLRRWFPDFTMGEPRTARGNRVRLVLVGVVLISLLISLPIQLAENTSASPHLLFSNAPVPTMVALIMVLGWGLVLPPLVVFARKNADEHKLATQDFGMMFGFQTFCISAPIWWMGHRGGLFPAPDVMILLIFVMLAAGITTIWKQTV